MPSSSALRPNASFTSSASSSSSSIKSNQSFFSRLGFGKRSKRDSSSSASFTTTSSASSILTNDSASIKNTTVDYSSEPLITLEAFGAQLEAGFSTIEVFPSAKSTVIISTSSLIVEAQVEVATKVESAPSRATSAPASVASPSRIPRLIASTKVQLDSFEFFCAEFDPSSRYATQIKQALWANLPVQLAAQ